MRTDQEQVGKISPAQLRLEMQGNVSLPARIQEDILVQILWELAKDTKRTRITSTLARWDWVLVTEVSRYWHAVAIGAPKLWSYLHDFSSRERLKHYLHLSKDSDLTIDYSEIRYAQTKELVNLKMVLEQMRRIRHLYIDLYKSEDASMLLSSLALAAPRLEIMDIKLFNLLKRLAFELPRTSPGILKSVSLSELSLSSSTSRFVGLSSLSLSSCTITMFDLQRTLKTCPTLISLSLTLCDIPQSEEVIKPIHLPCLTDLYLRHIQFPICCIFSENLEALNLANWAIHSFHPLRSEELSRISTFSKVLSGRSQYEAVQLSICSLRNFPSGQLILYEKFDYAGSIYEVGSDIDIPIDTYADLNVVLSNLAEASRGILENAENLLLGIIERSIIAKTWHHIFSISSSIKTLYCTFGASNGDNLMKSLKQASPQPTQSKSSKLPCSDLECLNIYWTGKEPDLTGFLRTLESVLKARSVGGSPLRKVSVLSQHSVPKNKKFEKFAKWVQEPDWITREEKREQQSKVSSNTSKSSHNRLNWYLL